MVISSGGWNVGVGNGTAGDNVIESSFPVPASARLIRLGFIYSDPAIGQDGLIAQAGGAPIVVATPAAAGAPTDIPTLTPAMLALLAALMIGVAFVAVRRSGIPPGPLAVMVLVLFSSLAWAAIVLDGMITDWAGVSPIATDSQGDSPAGSDISAAFAKIEAPRSSCAWT